MASRGHSHSQGFTISFTSREERRLTASHRTKFRDKHTFGGFLFEG